MRPSQTQLKGILQVFKIPQFVVKNFFEIVPLLYPGLPFLWPQAFRYCNEKKIYKYFSKAFFVLIQVSHKLWKIGKVCLHTFCFWSQVILLTKGVFAEFVCTHANETIPVKNFSGNTRLHVSDPIIGASWKITLMWVFYCNGWSSST